MGLFTNLVLPYVANKAAEKIKEYLSAEKKSLVFTIGEGLDKGSVLSPGPTNTLSELPKNEPVSFSLDQNKQKISSNVIAQKTIKKSIQTEQENPTQPVTVKVPFLPFQIQAEQGDKPTAFFQNLIKGTVEWPERIAKTLYQVGTTALRGEPTLSPTETEMLKKEGKLKPTVNTSIDEFKRNIEEDPYFSQHPYQAYSLAAFTGMLDLLPVGQGLQSSVERQLAKVTPELRTIESARLKMGFSPGETITENNLKTTYRNLAKITHPDAGGSAVAFNELNTQYNILKNKMGKTGAIQPLSAFDRTYTKVAEKLDGNIKDFFKTSEGTPYIGVRGYLPEKAGTVPTQPFQPYRQPAFGLSTREVPSTPAGVFGRFIEKNTSVDDTINALEQEARKYPTADEFVNNQLTIYRGGISDGKYFSTSKIVAADFAKNRGGSVSEYTLMPSAKVINYDDIPVAQYKGINDYNMENYGSGKELLYFQNGKLEADYTKAEKWAKENGYDVVKFPTEGEIRIINDKAIASKSQLTDIWNKANTKTSEQSLIEEAKKYKSAEEFVKAQGTVDKIFNASGKYPKSGIDFVRKLKQLVTDNEMSVISGGKTYSATKQQISDAGKLLESIRNNDLKLAEKVWSKYPLKKKMVTGNTSFVAHDNVYNELSTKAQNVVGELRKINAQLTDIWNKAHESAPENKILEDVSKRAEEQELPKLPELKNQESAVSNPIKDSIKSTEKPFTQEAQKYKIAKDELAKINKQIGELGQRANLISSEQGIIKIHTERNRLESFQATAEQNLKDIGSKNLNYYGENFTTKELTEPAEGIILKTPLEQGEFYPIKKQQSGGYRAIDLNSGKLFDIPPNNSASFLSGGWKVSRDASFDNKTVADVLDTLNQKTFDFYNKNTQKIIDENPLTPEEQAVFEREFMKDVTPPDRSFHGEMEGHYNDFVKIFSDPRINKSPAAKEALTNGDVETLRRELINRGIMSSEQVDNMLYAQDESGDAVLEKFKARLTAENPALMMGKDIAKNLGLSPVFVDAVKEVKADLKKNNFGIKKPDQKIRVVDTLISQYENEIRNFESQAPNPENTTAGSYQDLPYEVYIKRFKKKPKPLYVPSTASAESRLGLSKTSTQKTTRTPEKMGSLEQSPTMSIAQIMQKAQEEVSKVSSKDQARPFLNGKQFFPYSESINKDVTNVLFPGENVNTKVNILDYLRTPFNVLKKLGLEKEGLLLKQKYDDYLRELPLEINKVTEWFKRVPEPEASQRIFQYLDGKLDTLPEKELIVAKEIREYLKEWAGKLGLPEDKQIAHYITHLFDDDFIQKEFSPELAKLIADKVPGSVYDPFLQKRLGAKGYKEDVWQALDAYVKRGVRKYNMDVALEPLKKAANGLDVDSYKYVEQLGARVNLRPTALDNLFDNFFKSSPIGYKLGSRPVANISRKIRRMVYRATLGLNFGSAVRNLTQAVNTYSELGEKYTVKGYLDLAKSIMQKSDELNKVGVLRDEFIQDRVFNATKKTWEKIDKGLFFLFEQAERINRGSAYFGAKAKYLREGLNEEEAVKKALQLVEKTQFRFGSVDTPLALQSDIAKFFTQFQSFNVKQAEFLAGKIKARDVAGMIRYIFGSFLMVGLVGSVIGLDWKDMIPFSGVLSGQTKLGETPFVKVIGEILKALFNAPDKYGNPVSLGKKALNVGEAIAAASIPAFSQIKKTAGGVVAIEKGGSFTKNGRLQFKQGDSLPEKAKTLLFGKYSSKEAQDYFSKNKSSSDVLVKYGLKNTGDDILKKYSIDPGQDILQKYGL